MMSETTNKYQVMPPLSDEEYQALKEDIAERGVMLPVVLDGEGNVIDGHHRIQAVEELREEGRDVSDPISITRWDLETDHDKRDEAWRLNMQRRHLNHIQKQRAIAAKLKESPEWADNRIGKLLGVDGKTVRSLRLNLEQHSEIPQVEKLVGADGKEYPRWQTRTVPATTKDPEQTLTRVPNEGPLRWAHAPGFDPNEREDHARKVAEMKKKARDREERHRAERRKRPNAVFLDVGADLSKSRRFLKSAFDKQRGVEFDDEAVDLLKGEIEAIRGLLRLFDSALTGESGTDWDAELAKIEEWRQYG